MRDSAIKSSEMVFDQRKLDSPLNLIEQRGRVLGSLAGESKVNGESYKQSPSSWRCDRGALAKLGSQTRSIDRERDHGA
jgi:hypothetical protein